MTTGVAVVMIMMTEIETEIIVDEMIATATSDGTEIETMKDVMTDAIECAVDLLNTPLVSMMVVCIKNIGKFLFQCSVLASGSSDLTRS